MNVLREIEEKRKSQSTYGTVKCPMCRRPLELSEDGDTSGLLFHSTRMCNAGDVEGIFVCNDCKLYLVRRKRRTGSERVSPH